MGARGTTNGNVRGSSYARRARKWWLLATFQSPRFGAGWTHCYRCLALLCFDTITVDRIVPGCQGGRYVRGNIRPACSGCNSETGGRTRGNLVPSERKARDMKIGEQVRQMHPPRYTRAQAAELVGRDEDTLKRWKRDGVFVPSDQKTFGQLVVGLYTDDDIQAMKRLTKTLKSRKKKTA